MSESKAVAPVVTLTNNNQLTTTSQNVAEVFGKQHKDVIRSIENLKGSCPVEFHERNFAPMFQDVQVGNGATRQSPMYLLTRDGLTLLVMGYTGKEAMKFKIAYIEAFNAMEAKLKAEQMKALSSGEGGPQGRERSENPALQTSSVSLRSTPSPEGADDEIVRDLCFQVRQRLLKKSLPERIAVWKRVVAALDGEAESVPAPTVAGGPSAWDLAPAIRNPKKNHIEKGVEDILRGALKRLNDAITLVGLTVNEGNCPIKGYRRSLHIAATSNINAAGAIIRAMAAAEDIQLGSL